MPAPKKYSDELKTRAVRLTLDALGDPATKHGAYKRIAAQLDLNASDPASLGTPSPDR